MWHLCGHFGVMLIDLQKERKPSQAGHDPIQDTPQLPRTSWPGDRGRPRGGRSEEESLSAFPKGRRVHTHTRLQASSHEPSTGKRARERCVPSRGPGARAAGPQRGRGRCGGRSGVCRRGEGPSLQPRGPRGGRPRGSFPIQQSPPDPPPPDSNSPGGPPAPPGAGGQGLGAATPGTHRVPLGPETSPRAGVGARPPGLSA